MWTAAEFLRAGDDFSIGRAGRKIMGYNIKIWSTPYEYSEYSYEYYSNIRKLPSSRPLDSREFQ